MQWQARGRERAPLRRSGSHHLPGQRRPPHYFLWDVRRMVVAAGPAAGTPVRPSNGCGAAGAQAHRQGSPSLEGAGRHDGAGEASRHPHGGSRRRRRPSTSLHQQSVG